MDKTGWINAAQALGRIGGAMDPNPNGFARRMGEQGVDVAQAELIRRELQKQKEQEKKAKKGNFVKQAGSALGTIALTAAGVPAPLAAALASAGSTAAGNAVAGRDIDFGELLLDGGTAALSAYATPALLNGAAGVEGPVGTLAKGVQSLPNKMGDAAFNAGVRMDSPLLARTGYKIGHATGSYLQQAPLRRTFENILSGRQEEPDVYSSRYGVYPQ